MPALQLFENEHIAVSLLENGRIALVVRKPTRSDVSELDHVWGAANRALGGLGRAAMCLLVDVRAAVGRNEEEFELAFAPYRKSLSSGWCAVALVVASVSGKLQAQRYAREDQVGVRTFDDRDAALEWLNESLSRR